MLWWIFSLKLNLSLHFNLDMAHVALSPMFADIPCAALFSYPKTIVIIPSDL
jgi:hypothetical protein